MVIISLYTTYIFFSGYTFCLFLRWYFKSSFRFTAKLSGRYRDFPYTSQPYTCNSFRHYQHLPAEWYICYIWYNLVQLLYLTHEPYRHIITQSPEFIFGFTLGGVPSISFKKCIMICIHHTQYFHCPKNPLCSTYSFFAPRIHVSYNVNVFLYCATVFQSIILNNGYIVFYPVNAPYATKTVSYLWILRLLQISFLLKMMEGTFLCLTLLPFLLVCFTYCFYNEFSE